MIDTDAMRTLTSPPRTLTPIEAAGCLVVMLHRNGATFEVLNDGRLVIHLDRVTFPFNNTPDYSEAALRRLIDHLMPDIREIVLDLFRVDGHMETRH